jgi:nicotinamide-nucleotide amidase
MKTNLHNDLYNLAAEVGRKLKAKNAMLATAESCTGGGIAEAITRIPGSSAWFDRAFIAYSYPAKTDMLHVQQSTLDRVGAVSESAGPDRGTPEKPVGTVWFAWAQKNKPTISEVCVFSGDRSAVRHQTIVHALTKLMETAA